MKSRKTIKLTQRFNKRWLGYAAAAGATCRRDTQALLARAVPAGAVALGLLGGADGALANTIVYTPANITLEPLCVLSGGCGSYGRYRGSLGIDLNHDGINEFTLVQSSRLNLDFATRSLLGSGNAIPGALSKGAVIGPGRTFALGPFPMAYAFTNYYPICSNSCGRTFRYGGSWRNVDGFLGMEFQIDGATHFGWAELDVSWPPLHFANVTLEGYAYDTVTGQSIEAGQTTSAPEPGTLGLLALGSLGIGLWSRRRAASSQ